MRKRNGFHYRLFWKKNAIGLGILIMLAILLGFFKNSLLPQNTAIQETLPFYNIKVAGTAGNFKITPPELLSSKEQENSQVVYAPSETKHQEPVPNYTALVEEITYQPETDIEITPSHLKEELTAADLEKLKDIQYLKNNFYIVDKRTDITAGDIDPEEFINKDFSIDTTSPGPKVLIFHTHSSEGYADSDMSKGIQEGIWGTGEKLKEILETKYGIEVLHDSGRYDVVDGKNQILGAYERMEPAIRKILEENPSIEFVIDMHRDGVPEGTHLVKNINGKDTAQIMFFNGLCRLYQNGSLGPIAGLTNPYIRDNLALSFQMQLTANQLYPTFTRKVYVNAYRYSLHMLPKSMLIEVGAQTNTKQESYNAMELLADVLAQVILAP